MLPKDSSIYFCLEEYLSETKIAEQFGELLEVPIAQIRLIGHIDSRGLTRALVETHLRELMHLQEWGSLYKSVITCYLWLGASSICS